MFCAQKSYWGCCDKTERNFDQDLRHDTRNPKFFERDPTGLRAGIAIEKLRKVGLSVNVVFCIFFIKIR